MPLHAVQQGDKPIDSLNEAVKALEKKGEAVVSTQSFANQWLIITEAAPKARPKRETR